MLNKINPEQIKMVMFFMKLSMPHDMVVTFCDIANKLAEKGDLTDLKDISEISSKATWLNNVEEYKRPLIKPKKRNYLIYRLTKKEA